MALAFPATARVSAAHADGKAPRESLEVPALTKRTSRMPLQVHAMANKVLRAPPFSLPCGEKGAVDGTQSVAHTASSADGDEKGVTRGAFLIAPESEKRHRRHFKRRRCRSKCQRWHFKRHACRFFRHAKHFPRKLEPTLLSLSFVIPGCTLRIASDPSSRRTPGPRPATHGHSHKTISRPPPRMANPAPTVVPTCPRDTRTPLRTPFIFREPCR